MTHIQENKKYVPRIGDFVAKLVDDTDWVVTGIITGSIKIANTNLLHKICWTTVDSFPVSNRDFYETYENIDIQKIVIIRNEQDIPSSFLVPN